MTLTKLIDYRNQYPQLGLPRSHEEFNHREIVTYETLINSGFIDQLKTKSDISVILRTGGTSSLAYKILPSSPHRFKYNDRAVSQQLLFDVIIHQGALFVADLLHDKVVFLPGNMFESEDIPMRYVSNALVSEKGRLGDWICPVPQSIFDGVDLSDASSKLRAIALCYAKRSPAVVSGIPGVVIQFARIWQELYGEPLSPQVVITGGCAVSPYIVQLRATLGDDVVIIPYYNATEGTFGYQPEELWHTDDYETLQLKQYCGIHYEVVDSEGVISDLSQVSTGIQYRLLISTYDGLCRYEIGDVIEFIDVAKSWIKIVGRTSEYIDIANEHTQIQHVQQAISQLREYYDIGPYCLFPSQDGGVWHYVLVVESSGYGGTKRKELVLDSSLHSEGQIAERFDDLLPLYNSSIIPKRINGTLGLTKAYIVEQGWFDDLIAQLNHERQSTQSKLLTLYPREDNPVNKKLFGF